MGCVYSKVEYGSPNPRIFQVWNVDGAGRHVKPGKIEVTESELVLYHKGDLTVKWPLKSLRRYGFDAELFSFECGRRCPTGPGVYAFKCRRAEALFNVLQESLQNSGGFAGLGNISIASIDEQANVSPPAQAVTSVPLGSSSNAAIGNVSNSTPRQSPAVDSSGYLEPITASQHNTPCPHNSTGQRNSGVNGSATSPGANSVCIHSMGSEGMTVEWSANATSSSLPTCCSFGVCSRTSNSGQSGNRDVVEPVSPSFSRNACTLHQYMNASVIATHPSRRGCSTKCQSRSQSVYVKSRGCCTVSCMHCVDVNTNYAKLDDLLKQEQSVKKQHQQRCYVNIRPEQTGSTSGACGRCVSGRSTPNDCLSRCRTFTPPTSTTASLKSRTAHGYANLGSPKSVSSFEAPPKPEEKTQVNYAVLDLDNNNTTHQPPSTSVSKTSGRASDGYVQIDFDRTIALSNSTIPCLDDDSVRITRHSGVSLPFVSMPS